MGAEGAVALQPHQELVVEEKKNLDTKIDTLKDYVGSPEHTALPEDEKTHLATQLHHMKEYAAALGHRIAAFV